MEMRFERERLLQAPNRLFVVALLFTHQTQIEVGLGESWLSFDYLRKSCFCLVQLSLAPRVGGLAEFRSDVRILRPGKSRYANERQKQQTRTAEARNPRVSVPSFSEDRMTSDDEHHRIL